MAFPQVASTSSGNSGANTTSPSLTLPSGITAGDLLIMAFCVDSTTPTPTWPSGWTQIFTHTATEIQLQARYRIADGSEGASISLTTGNFGSCYFGYRITGHDAATAPATTGNTTSNNNQPNPASLNPSGWDIEDTLWIAMCGWDNGTTSLSSYPTDYSSNQLTNRWNNSDGVGIAAATREVAAASEDPGVFTISTSIRWAARTIAVRPAAGGGKGKPFIPNRARFFTRRS